MRRRCVDKHFDIVPIMRYVAPKLADDGRDSLMGSMYQPLEMSPEYFNVCMIRVIRKLKMRGLPAGDQSFANFDSDKDGRLNKGEWSRAFSDLSLGCSGDEIEGMFRRLDVKQTLQFVSLDDFRQALLEAEISHNQSPTLWADEVFVIRFLPPHTLFGFHLPRTSPPPTHLLHISCASLLIIVCVVIV